MENLTGHVLRTGEIEDREHKALIDHKHKINLFKLRLMPAYEPDIALGIPE